MVTRTSTLFSYCIIELKFAYDSFDLCCCCFLSILNVQERLSALIRGVGSYLASKASSVWNGVKSAGSTVAKGLWKAKSGIAGYLGGMALDSGADSLEANGHDTLAKIARVS